MFDLGRETLILTPEDASHILELGEDDEDVINEVRTLHPWKEV